MFGSLKKQYTVCPCYQSGVEAAANQDPARNSVAVIALALRSRIILARAILGASCTRIG
jgi:hypothetical protein